MEAAVEVKVAEEKPVTVPLLGAVYRRKTKGGGYEHAQVTTVTTHGKFSSCTMFSPESGTIQVSNNPNAHGVPIEAWELVSVLLPVEDYKALLEIIAERKLRKK